MAKEKSFIPQNAFLRVIEKDGRIEIIINADLVKVRDDCDTFLFVDAKADVIVNINEIHSSEKCLIAKPFKDFAKKFSHKNKK